MIRRDVEVEVTTGDSAENIQNVTDNTDKLNKELNETDKSAKKSSKGFSLFGKSLKGVGNVIKTGLGLGIGIKLFEKITEVLSENQVIVDTVNKVFTTMSIVVNDVFSAVTDAFTAVSEANGGFQATQKVVGNLIDIALAPLKILFDGIKLTIFSVQKAWEESIFGDGDQDTIDRLNGKIKATQESIKETGEGVIESGKEIGENFSDAVREVSNAAVEVTKSGVDAIKNVSVEAAFQQADAIEEARKNLERLEIQQQALIERYDREAEIQRQIRDDVNKSFQDRIAANERLGEILTKQAKEEKETINARIASIRRENELLGETEERNLEILRLNTELQAVDARITGQRSENLTNQNSLIQEQRDLRRQGLQDERRIANERELLETQEIEKESERLAERRQIIERQNQNRLDDLQREIDAQEKGSAKRIQLENEYRKAKFDSEKKISELVKKESEARIKEEEAVNKAKRDSAVSTLESIGGLLRQFSEQSKELAIAAVLIDSAVAAIRIFSSSATLPEPAATINRYIQLGALAVSTKKSIDQINSAKAGAGSGSGSAATSSGGAPPQGANPNRTISGGGDGLSTLNRTQMVKSYVVGTDITNLQQLERRIEENSSFG